MKVPWRRKRISTRVDVPMPLVEAIGRAPLKSETWEVRDSGKGPAHTDLYRGVLAVPLSDDSVKCPECRGPNHNDAIRTHELIHVRLSPVMLENISVEKDWVDKIEEEMKTNGGFMGIHFDQFINRVWEGAVADPSRRVYIPQEYFVAAEEYMVETVRHEIASRMKVSAKHYVCMPRFRASLIELLIRKKPKEAAFLYVATGNSKDTLKIVSQLVSGTYLNKYKSERALYTYAIKLAGGLYNLQYWIGYINGRIETTISRSETEERYRYKRDAIALLLWFWLKDFDRPPPKGGLQQLVDEGKLDEDLIKPFEQAGLRSGKAEGMMADLFRKHLIGLEDASGVRGAVKWGHMEMQKAKLSESMPNWKAQRLNVATDEGTLPLYMHRYAVDGRVFRRINRQVAASVLIDDSGSMGFTARQIDEIIAKVPGVIIGVYAGSDGGDGRGILKIVAENGKRAKGEDLKVNEYGGNGIDKPALEWLSKQPEPRIWVSDGQVVSPSHSFSAESIADCAAVCVKGKINRAENATEAMEMLMGKKELYR